MVHSENTVVVATVASLEQADIIKAVLEGNGVDALVPDSLTATTMTHMAIGRKPNGFPVLVRESDLEAAQAILSEKYDPAALDAAAVETLSDKAGQDQGSQEVSSQLTLSEQQARRALVCAVLWIVCPPLVLLVPLFAIKAARAAAREPQTRTRAYYRDLISAAVLVLGPAAALTLYVLLYG